jgi:hypothetical protein
MGAPAPGKSVTLLRYAVCATEYSTKCSTRMLITGSVPRNTRIRTPTICICITTQNPSPTSHCSNLRQCSIHPPRPAPLTRLLIRAAVRDHHQVLAGRRRPARSIPNLKWNHPPAPSQRRRPCGGRGLDDRRLRLSWKTPLQRQAQIQSAAVRQSHGVSPAQYSRLPASFVAGGR